MVRGRRSRGFSLLEALAALVLAVLLFGGISLYTGTWLRHWERIVDSSSRDDNVAVVLDRMVEDIEAALPLHERDETRGQRVLFDAGVEEIRFVRPALGFDVRAGLDSVTYLSAGSGQARAVVRSRRDHGDEDNGGEDLPLLSGGTGARFAFAASDGEFYANLPNPSRLPQLVRVELHGQSPGPWSRTSYARLRVEWPAVCGRSDMLPHCLERYGFGP
jgi:general secretion pathway protein J